MNQLELRQEIEALKKRVAELEVRAQAQPETFVVDRLRRLAEDVVRKLTKGEMTQNEARVVLGLKPLTEPGADERLVKISEAVLEAGAQAQSREVEPPSRGDKHYQLVRDVFELLADHNLTVREVEQVLAQVRAIMGYTPVRWRA